MSTAIMKSGQFQGYLAVWPCSYELDPDTLEATGTVALFCSKECHLKHNIEFDKYQHGESIASPGTCCWQCGKALA